MQDPISIQKGDEPCVLKSHAGFLCKCTAEIEVERHFFYAQVIAVACILPDNKLKPP